MTGTMEVDHPATLDDFLQTGRTGRRNAISDIKDANASVSTASLPDSMHKLTCSDVEDASCSGQNSNSAQSSQNSGGNHKT